MALGNSDITHLGAKSESGQSGTTDNLNSAIVGYSSISPYSFWGPGALSVDANKDIVITPPPNNEKLGDFRQYNHTASTPSGGPGLTTKWGPGGTTASFTVAVNVEQLNHGSFAVPPTHIRLNFYLSTADRAAETNLHYGLTTILTTGTSHTIPLGHTRALTSVYKMSSPQQISVTSFPVTGLSKPDIVYIDAFLCNSGGSRLVNLPTVSGGYSTMNIDEYTYPTIVAGSIVVGGGTGYGVAIRDDTSGGCSGTEIITKGLGDTGFTAYVTPMKFGSPNKRLTTTGSLEIYYTRNSTKHVLYTGNLTGTYKQVIESGMSPGLAYDEVITLNIGLLSGSWTETNC
jgi:hypothetical protein